MIIKNKKNWHIAVVFPIVSSAFLSAKLTRRLFHHWVSQAISGDQQPFSLWPFEVRAVHRSDTSNSVPCGFGKLTLYHCSPPPAESPRNRLNRGNHTDHSPSQSPFPPDERPLTWPREPIRDSYCDELMVHQRLDGNVYRLFK